MTMIFRSRQHHVFIVTAASVVRPPSRREAQVVG